MKMQQAHCPVHGNVIAVKNTHKLRNAVTGVMWLGIGSKVEPYMCPMCGGPVTLGRAPERSRKPTRKERKAKVVKLGGS